METEMRIDKWLWSVRLYKTRTLAAEACRKGKVLVAGVEAKPSRNIKVGDIIQIKRNPVLFSYEVLALTERRVGAKLVSELMKDVTTPDQLELYELGKIAAKSNRERGKGRPTKKERRDLEAFLEPVFWEE
ncbi:MAG TPA: RNA-binding S4 domain-containing protein [Paludibacter sp.]|jgi:ribosome-associated heat shock protein Hsp15|nr:MAG: Heat shock protein 15 [Bacteroidetes bacterium ADurb.Bin174]HQB27876.1 RNA-binding S4 domain-containing protein [Paludibacter sp.]